MVNVADLIKVKNCGPKRAMYIYERLPLTHWDSTVYEELEGDDRLMRNVSGGIISDLVAKNSRRIEEFQILNVVVKHLDQNNGTIRDRYMYERKTHGHQETMHRLCQWWISILQAEKSKME